MTEKRLPKYHETFIPILKVLEREGMMKTRDLRIKVRDEFYNHLPEELFKEKTKSGEQLLLNRIGFGKAYLRMGNYVEIPERGLVQITNKGKEDHTFVEMCNEHGIKQKFTRIKTPRTNGKAERVIRTLMELWHHRSVFKNRAHREKELRRFVNWYNTVKPHAGIEDCTPEEKLLEYFYPKSL